MSKRLLIALTCVAVGVAACGDDDPVDPIQEDDPLVGVWVSAGANVAPGLAPFADSIIADFRANQTYEVLQYPPGDASVVTLTGTWVAGDGGENTIRAITVTQTSPTQLTATGIFRVSGNAMEYEVIQAEPALEGVQPPTVAGGFGSTTIGGTPNALFIQNYVRRN